MSIIRLFASSISLSSSSLENSLFTIGILERIGTPFDVFSTLLLPKPPIIRIPLSGTETVTDNSCFVVTGRCILFVAVEAAPPPDGTDPTVIKSVSLVKSTDVIIGCTSRETYFLSALTIGLTLNVVPSSISFITGCGV